MGTVINISRGRKLGPMIYTIYGIPGVGKTTWASQFPDALILDLEKGSEHLDTARMDDIESYGVFKERISMLLGDVQGFKTIIVDSLEKLEGLMLQEMVATGLYPNYEEANKFNNGQKLTASWMREVMTLFRKMVDLHKVEVIFVAHSQVVKFNDPDGSSFDRYTMRVNDHMGAVVRDLSHNVFFACHKVHTTKDGHKIKGLSDGERILKTEWRASFDAKSRIEGLPFEIPLSYAALRKAIETAKPKSAEELKNDIKQMSEGLDEETRSKVLEALQRATTVEELMAYKNRVQTLVAA